ncbi:MAG: hypothetical protein WCA47_13450 [Terriglobales bacterium]|jgi:hypothetical protein
MKNLTSHKCLALVSVFAALAVPNLASAATAATPIAGIYGVSSYVVSANATNGGTCGAQPGTYLSSYFYYPGPAKTGAVERHSINGSQGSFIQELDFPETPATKIDTWSGDYTSTRFSGGTPETGTFSTIFTFVDVNSFLATTTYNYSVGQNSVCTTVFQNTYIRSGK